MVLVRGDRIEAAGANLPIPAGARIIDLGGAEGRFVLLWITGFGEDPSPDCEANPYGATITELSVVGS